MTVEGSSGTQVKGLAPKHIKLLTILLGILVQAPAFYLARSRSPFDTDELALGLSVVHTWIGVPLLSLAWPASLHVVLGQFYVVGTFATSHGGHSLSSLGHHLAGICADPYGLLSFMRYLTVILAAGAITVLARHLLKKGMPWWLVVAVSAALAVQPNVMHHTMTAKGDGPGIWLAVIAMVMAVSEPKVKPVWIGTVLGLMFACRLSYFPIAAIVGIMAIVARYGETKPLAVIKEAVPAFFIAFLLPTPFIWADPLRYMKNVLVHILETGPRFGMKTALIFQWHMMGPGMTVLILSLVAFAVLQRRWLTLVLSAALAGFFIMAVAKQSSYYDRYLLPTLLMIPMILIDLNYENKSKLQLGWAAAVTAVCAVLVPQWVKADIDHVNSSVRDQNTYKEAVAAAIAASANGKSLIPLNILTRGVGIEDNMSPQAAKRVENDALRAYATQTRIAYDKNDLLPLKDAVAERERGLIAQMRLVEYYTKGKADIQLWDPGDSGRFGCVTEDKAVALLQKGQANAMLIPVEDVSKFPGLKVSQTFRDLALVTATKTLP